MAFHYTAATTKHQATLASKQQYRGTKRTLARLVLVGGILLALLVIVTVIAWALQRSMIYFPDTSQVPPAAEVLQGGQDLTLETADGLKLDAWFAPAAPDAQDRDMAVLMAPGNGGNRQHRVGIAQHLQDQGFAVLVMDYRGYSTNPGSPTEDGVVQDGHAALDALQAQGYTPEQLIYYGESVGGGVIAALLADRPPAAAIFRSPFTELADVGRHHYPFLPVDLILRDRFPVTEPIRESHVPVTVIRAEEDSVVPAELSAEVAQAAQPNLVTEHVIADADHNAPVMFGPEIAEVVAQTVDALQDEGTGVRGRHYGR